ncbi:hypothetical protein ACH5RR_020254 [Cinchona calisaya]|uniref:Proteinase inhibitor n=1 Tax=Cinchona calisaya TaxID=153742 RepID=A0ABD2ZHC5_9GENT
MFLNIKLDTFSYGTTGKTSWPELVGANGYAAASIIEKENRHVRAIVLLDGTPVTMDFRCDRVWVWNNKDGIVLSWPELVGANGFAAASIIEKENPHVRAIIVLQGTPGTSDFNCYRVRVVVNKGGIVIQTPFAG